MKIYMFGAVGDPQDGFTPDSVAEKIRGYRGELEVFINSPGGFAFDGVAVYNLLKPLQPRVEVLGMAASAASVIAMAGETVHVATGASLMVHNAWAMTAGDHREHERSRNTLQRLTNQLLDIYTARATISRDRLAGLLDAETWLSGKQAVDIGLADSWGTLETRAADALQGPQQQLNSLARYEETLKRCGLPDQPARPQTKEGKTNAAKLLMFEKRLAATGA